MALQTHLTGFGIYQTNPIFGIGLAIIGHAAWNGSSWFVSWLFMDQDIIVQIIASLSWIIVMIVTLWLLEEEILAAVMPSSVMISKV